MPQPNPREFDPEPVRKERSCALWICIKQHGNETWYRLRRQEPLLTARVRWQLSKYIEGAGTRTKYMVEERTDGSCVCDCPDWSRHQRDCKHILALRSNGILAGTPTPVPKGASR